MLFVGNEAASAAPKEGGAKSRTAIIFGYPMWSVAVRCDAAIWVEGLPSKLNPADLPSRAQGFRPARRLEFRDFRGLPAVFQQ